MRDPINIFLLVYSKYVLGKVKNWIALSQTVYAADKNKKKHRGCGFHPPPVTTGVKGLLQMLKMGVCKGFLGGWDRKGYWFLKIRAYNGEFGHLSSKETNNFEELAYQRSQVGIFSENAL